MAMCYLCLLIVFIVSVEVLFIIVQLIVINISSLI